MGSLSEGTMCWYCGVNHAGYIPDGCNGPACGPCIDVGLEWGWEYVEQKLWMRLWPACATRIAAINRSTHEDLLTLLAHVPTLPVRMAACLEDELLGCRSAWTAPITAPSMPISKAKAKAKAVTSPGGDRGAGGAGGDPGAGAPAYDDSYGATVYVAAGEVGIFRAYQVNAGADTTTGEALSLVMGLQLNRHVPVDRVHACFIYAHHISAALTLESSYDNRITESGFESLDWHPGELFRDRVRRFSPYLVVYPRVRL